MPSVRQSHPLLAIKPAVMARRSTLLAVAPVWIGLIAWTAADRPIQGLLVALGAYIVLFGAGRPVRSRLRAHVIAAVGLLATVTLGMFVAGNHPLTWAAYLVTAVLAVWVTGRIDPGPPGAYFFVLMTGAGTLLAATGLGVVHTLVHLAIGVLLAMTFGVIDALTSRPAPSPPPPVPPAAPSTRLTLLRVGIAITATMAISWLRGDLHPFWGVLVVVLVLSYPGDTRQLTTRALARLLGTLVGVALFAPLADLHFGTAWFIAVLCVLLWFVARWTTRNYLIGSVLITLLALFMTVPLTPDETPLQITAARALNTVIAGLICLAVLGLPRRPARH